MGRVVNDGGGGRAAKANVETSSGMGEVGTAGGVTVEWGAVTDVGLLRAINEDAVLMRPPVFLVADGMGGHHAGDVASRLVIEEFARAATAETLLVDDVVSAIHRANAAVVREGSADDGQSGMGTTAVGLVLVDNGPTTSWLLFNVGDSRAYRLADGMMKLLSVDHSYVQELVAAGEITETDARTHPNRNVVTRALGADDDTEADLWILNTRPGDRYVLCSDGLTTEVADADIEMLLVSEPDPAVAARSLVERALSAGGRDNVSVIVVDVLSVEAEVDGFSEATAPRGIQVVGVPATYSPVVDPPVTEEHAAVDLTHVEPDLDAVPSDESPLSSEMETENNVAEDAPSLIAGVPDFDTLTDGDRATETERSKGPLPLTDDEEPPIDGNPND